MIRHLAAALLVAVQLFALRADQDSSITSETGDLPARLLAASLQSDDPTDAGINSALMRELHAGNLNFSQGKVLAYELLRRRNSLSSSEIAALQPVLAAIYGAAGEAPDVLGLSGELMARRLLEHKNGSSTPAFSQTSDWRELGLDDDLLNGQLFLPVSVDRFKNYIAKQASPSRTSIYLATFRLTQQAMSTSQGSGSLPTAEQTPEPTQEQIVRARRVLSEPNAVDNQIAHLLKNIVDTGRKRLRLRVSGAGAQVVALAHEHSLNAISQAKCGQSEDMRTLGGEVASLNRSESISVKKLLKRAGILSPVTSSVGCSRSSLVVNGTNGLTGVGYMAVFSPDRKSGNAGVLFSGFEENFWIEEVGAKGRRGVYLARTVAGSGGYLNAHLIDANTGHELFAVDTLPDGELLTLLPGATSPQYLVLRQSVTTVKGTGCNACDKNTLTAIFAFGKADRYELLNIKISRSVKKLNRIEFLHRAQLPSVVARVACVESRLSEEDCLNSLQAASIEATARIDIDDVQGAIRVLDSANRRLWSTLSTSSTELDRAALTQSFVEEAAARLMDGQTRETIEMCKALTSSDLFSSLIIKARDMVELACDNLSGLAYNEQGDLVLAAERFTHAFAKHSDDPVLIGNLARIMLDQAGRRNAAAVLVQVLFRQSGGPVFTHHQDMAIGESTVYMHKTWESLLFLFPKENLKQSTIGLNLWKGGEIASLSGLKDLPTLLLDESMHYLDQRSLLSIGPSILLTYARELGNGGKKASAKDILGRLATSDVSHEVRAQALDMLARAVNEAGDEALAFRLSDRSVDSLRLRAASRTSGRFTSSMMGAHRYIVENWFQLARKRGVDPAALYEEAARWKFDRALGAPDVENSIRGRLETNEMRLEYLVVGEEVWRFLLVGSDVSLFILPISSAELSRRVLELTHTLSEASTKVVGADRVVLVNQLTKLSSVLLTDLKIGGVKKLFIGSDTGLAGFPWIALRGAAGAWLVDEIDIVEFLPSAHFAKGDSLGAHVHLGVIGSTQSISLSALFSPDQTILPALGGVRRELAAIASAWPQGAATVLSDVSAGATAPEAEGGWKKLMQSVDVVHIAAHGDFNKYLPRQSRIALSRQMGGGVISVAEIEDLNLSRLRLAVLNVCHSGSLQRFDSFGEIGFRSALLSAGAGAVISAGWAIQDTAAADFAQEFYGQLAQGKSISNSYVKAVRLAKKRYSTPAVWAAYALTVIKGPPG